MGCTLGDPHSTVRRDEKDTDIFFVSGQDFSFVSKVLHIARVNFFFFLSQISMSFLFSISLSVTRKFNG